MGYMWVKRGQIGSIVNKVMNLRVDKKREGIFLSS
jgi:hypothetical protein